MKLDNYQLLGGLILANFTLVQADIWTIAQTEEGNVVFIRPRLSGTVVPIFIGQLEAQSILIGLGKLVMPRPLTHDLFINTIKTLGFYIERVSIDELRDGTFFASMDIHSSDKSYTVDCRPSDAIAIAVRIACEIYISESIVEEAGIPVEAIKEGATIDTTTFHDKEPELDGLEINENKASWKGMKNFIEERKKLEKELARAIAEENYELAAQIRDRLELL